MRHILVTGGAGFNNFEMITTGNYIRGCKQAHLANSVHTSFFGYPMFGTFNVQTKMDIEKFNPIIISPDGCHRYYHVRIDNKYDAWVWRRGGSQMLETTWELVSKEPLPDNLKNGIMKLEVLET